MVAKTKAKEDEAPLEQAQLTVDALAELTSFDDAVAYLGSAGVGIVSTDEVEDLIGDGFQYVNKNALVNMPFVILEAKQGMSPNYNAPYILVRAMTATNRKVKFIDFGAGFREEIASFERRSGRSAVGIVAKGGLVANTYTTTDSDGNDISATTYRLNIE
jgi:hypothetical protein